jgi:glutamate-1-semialdehyde 2,1-aminomutase
LKQGGHVTNSVAQSIIRRYQNRTPESRLRDARAKEHLPGGDTRSATYFLPYPSYMVKGDGCHLYDCDGNTYLDFLSNYTSLVHGHAFPPVIRAVRAQLLNGTVLGSVASSQAELAEILCRRIPGMEMVRFCNSGTEATMMAMRAARAFRGKDIIVKMDGHYHGAHDYAEVNIIPAPEPDGLPSMHLEGAGVPARILDTMMVARFNDLESVETVLKQHADKIAGIIVEPMTNSVGTIPPKPGYLQGLRELADHYGVLLIFDEIVTFRLGLGGLQSLEDVQPDITTLGKIIGGGFPVGAFGGRREVMSRFDPAHPQTLVHSGTFCGHNITMAAGVAALQNYGQGEIDRINTLGQRLRTGFDQAFRDAGIRGQTTGLGSVLFVHWRDGEIREPRDTGVGILGAKDLPGLLHLEMMNQGIYSAFRGMYCVSTPMTEKEIDRAIEAFGAALGVLKPHVREVAPHLLTG